MPPLSARPASSATHTRSSAAPLFFSEHRGMRRNGRETLLCLRLAKAPPCPAVRQSKRTAGPGRLERRWNLRLARALPASLHTFLFRIRGWLHEQAARIGEELDKMQFRTWKPCLPFWRGEIAGPRQSNVPFPPASPNLPGKRLSLRAGIPGQSTDTAAALGPPVTTLESLWARWLFAPAPQHYQFNFQGGTMLHDLHEQLEDETINDILSRCLQLSLGRGGDSSSLNLSFLQSFPWKSERQSQKPF